VCFHHTLPFMTKQRSHFGYGYIQTAQEITESLLLQQQTAELALLPCSGVLILLYASAKARYNTTHNLYTSSWDT